MIKSIRLLNWRSHHDSRFEFHEGTNLLIGMMGAGKSSVLESIAFAFFGTFPALERRKLRLEDIIRLNEPFAKVVLEFGWDGTLYRIERLIERTKRGASSDAEIYKDNRLVDKGPVAVTTCICNLTGVDYDLFTRAIYSEQNNIDYFLTLDPKKRKQEIDALLGLDKLENARANAVTVIGRVRSKKQGIDERFSKQKMAELEQNEKTHAEKVAALRSKLASLLSVHDAALKELRLISSSFEELKKKKELFEKLEKELIRLTSTRDSLAKEAGEVDEKALQEVRQRLSILSEQRSSLTASLKSAEEKHLRASKEAGTNEARLKAASEANVRLDSLKKELAGLLGQHNRDSLAAEQTESEKALLSFGSERKSIESEISELLALIDKLAPGATECPLCGSKVTDVSHIRSEKKNLIEKKKARILELDGLMAASKKKNDELLAKCRKSSLLAEQSVRLEQELAGVAALQSKKAELETALSTLRGEREATAKKMDELSGELERLRFEMNKAETMLRKKSELGIITKKISESEAGLASLEFDSAAFESTQEKLQTARISAEKNISEKQSLETQLRMAEDLLRLLQAELSQMRQMEKDLKTLFQLEEELSIYKNALIEAQTSLRENLVDAINGAMNDLWPIFYPYRNYPALRLQVTEKDYLFEVNDARAWKALESMASGGERASAALTLRVALAMVLTPNLSWLILDEPTHNLDTEAIELLSSALQSKVPEVVKQTFVITHEEGLMGSDFASSYRLTRDKEHNGETKIEEI